VVDQIRVLGKDTSLLKETLHAAQEHLQCEVALMKEQRDAASEHLRSIGREIGELGARVGIDEEATRQLGRLQEVLREKQHEIQQIDDKIAGLHARMVEPDELAGAVEAFDPVWESLSPTEKAKLVHLLVDRVEYDAEDESISISYHSTGIHALIEENTLCRTT